jgi:hypothetical protein
MRPLLLGTDGKEELRIACERLRLWRLGASQRGPLAYSITPRAVREPLPFHITASIRRLSLWRLTRRIFGFVGFLAFAAGVIALLEIAPRGLNFHENGTTLLDRMVAAEVAPEPFEVGQWWHFESWPEVGHLDALFKGIVQTKADLPKEGNALGDMYFVSDTRHYWVWTTNRNKLLQIS